MVISTKLGSKYQFPLLDHPSIICIINWLTCNRRHHIHLHPLNHMHYQDVGEGTDSLFLQQCPLVPPVQL